MTARCFDPRRRRQTRKPTSPHAWTMMHELVCGRPLKQALFEHDALIHIHPMDLTRLIRRMREAYQIPPVSCWPRGAGQRHASPGTRGDQARQLLQTLSTYLEEYHHHHDHTRSLTP